MVKDHDTATVVQGENGILISSAKRPKVHGVTKSKKRLIASTHENSGLGICLFVPNSYDEVEIEIDGEVSNYKLNKIYRFHHRVVDVPDTGPSMLDWYNSSFSDDDDSDRPITLTALKEMVKSNANLHLIGGRYGHLETMVIVTLVAVIVVVIVLFLWYKGHGAPWANSDGIRTGRRAYDSFRMSDLKEVVEIKAGLTTLRQELMQSKADVVHLEDRVVEVERRTRQSGLLPYPVPRKAATLTERRTKTDLPMPNTDPGSDDALI